MGASNFKIIMSSDEKYNDLCAEIYYEGQFVAILSQEKGFENLEIEIGSPDEGGAWVFKVSEFLNILNSAKDALWKMRKISE